MQDVAVAIFLAYASRTFEYSSWMKWVKDASSSANISTSYSMGSLAMAIAAAACLVLVGYRLTYGDDHGLRIMTDAMRVRVSSRSRMRKVIWKNEEEAVVKTRTKPRRAQNDEKGEEEEEKDREQKKETAEEVLEV